MLKPSTLYNGMLYMIKNKNTQSLEIVDVQGKDLCKLADVNIFAFSTNVRQFLDC